MLRLFLCVAVVGTSTAFLFDFFGSDDGFNDYWGNYKKMFNKNYVDPEETGKRSIFRQNYDDIMEHNSGFDKGLFTYRLRENPFSDLSPEDFENEMIGYGDDMEAEEEPTSSYRRPDNGSVPDSVDWRKEGYVTRVQSQGKCKSCWAFAATGAYEGQLKKKTGKLIELSEQNLIDCSQKEGNNGCGRGRTSNAYCYLKKHGINKERYYPLEGGRGSCRFSPKNAVDCVTGYSSVAEGDEEALMWALANIGPISIAVDAKHKSFRHYGGGIFDLKECSSKKVNHAVLLVGYGTNNRGTDYWLIRNSWGTDWGDHGYMYLARNKNNMCGVATRPTYPVLGDC